MRERWDWSTVVFIVLAVTIVLALTLGLWDPHKVGVH